MIRQKLQLTNSLLSSNMSLHRDAIAQLHSSKSPLRASKHICPSLSIVTDWKFYDFTIWTTHRIASTSITTALQLQKAFVQPFKIDPLSSLTTTANHNESLEQAKSTFNFTILGSGLFHLNFSREVWLALWSSTITNSWNLWFSILMTAIILHFSPLKHTWFFRFQMVL